MGRGGEGEWGRGRHVVRKACDASLTGSATTIFFFFLLLQQLVGARYFYFLFKSRLSGSMAAYSAVSSCCAAGRLDPSLGFPPVTRSADRSSVLGSRVSLGACLRAVSTVRPVSRPPGPLGVHTLLLFVYFCFIIKIISANFFRLHIYVIHI